MSGTVPEAIQKIVLLILSLFAMAACGDDGQSDSVPTPPSGVAYNYRIPSQTEDGWPVASAATVGLSVTELESIVNDVRGDRLPIIDAIAVARGGQLVFTETLRTQLHQADNRVANSSLDLHVQNSVSKSFASVLTGIAIDQGLIASVDVAYLSLFPYPSYANDDAGKRAMRLEDVFTGKKMGTFLILVPRVRLWAILTAARCLARAKLIPSPDRKGRM